MTSQLLSTEQSDLIIGFLKFYCIKIISYGTADGGKNRQELK